MVTSSEELHAGSQLTGLRSFVETLVPSDNDYNKYINTQTGSKMYSLIGNETYTEPTAATIFWQIYIQALPKINTAQNFFFGTQVEYIVVSHGQGQYALLILDKFHTGPPLVQTIDKNQNKSELDLAFNTWRQLQENRLFHKMQYASNRRTGIISFGEEQQIQSDYNLLQTVDANFLQDLMNSINFSIIRCTAPDTYLTSTILTQPCNEIASAMGSPAESTAGVFTMNSQGQIGATICYHAVQQILQKPKPHYVYIGGLQAEIVSSDIISDSCFAVFTGAGPMCTPFYCKGPLSGKTPRQYHNANFDGISSGFKNTIINSWTPDLPFAYPDVQLRVLTDPDTNPGDSGAALTDDDNNVVGFAFRTTAPNQKPAYSSWIWAKSVYDVHNLNP
jgi:hypothetical protein